MGELERFLVAQDGIYAQATQELRDGAKRSHWMWFVFPQLAGLGRSPTARRYAITDLAEAQAYAAHPVLGPRLVECAEILDALPARSAAKVLGGIDALKLRSSMTLFARADPARLVFQRVLAHYFDGEPDPATEALLRGGRPEPRA